MAFTFNGTSQAITVSSAVVSSMPITISCWFRVPTAVSSNVRILVNITHSQDTGSGTGTYRLVIPANNALMRAVQILTGVVAHSADTAANTVLANTWMNAVAVFSATNSRTVYLTGANPFTNTGTAAAPSVNNFAIGCLLSTSPSFFYEGEIAEVGVWSAALNSSEVRSLSMGVSPSLVRPQSLRLHAPLVRDLFDTRGRSLTNVGNPTISSHPRVYL